MNCWWQDVMLKATQMAELQEHIRKLEESLSQAQNEAQTGLEQVETTHSQLLELQNSLQVATARVLEVCKMCGMIC